MADLTMDEVVGQGGVGDADGVALAEEVGARCLRFLRPLLEQLDRQIDRRLVRTLARGVGAVMRHRQRSDALLLSQLGAEIVDPPHGPAGTKRLANLLHSPKWRAETIDGFLRAQAQVAIEREAARVPEGRALCILDGSIAEKPESSQLEGLAPVNSAKARRLSRPRPRLGPGYWRGKPGGPIVVPGFSWLGVLITGWSERTERRPVTLGAWHWYRRVARTAVPLVAPTTTIPTTDLHTAEWTVVSEVVALWGAERLLHVWDRGFAAAAWLGKALDGHWHFVVRWKKGNLLRPASAPSVRDPDAAWSARDRDGRAAWRLTAGWRPWGSRTIANPRSPKNPLTVHFAARTVRLLGREEPLWLVIVRLGKTDRRRVAAEPWRLLTTEPVETPEQCWRIVVAYAARWQIEQMLRFGKSELGIESVRVRDWPVRAKLLAIVSLAYAFLVDLLADLTDPLVPRLLRWAHRTGRQARDAWRPLYRLRLALANLGKRHTPSFQGLP